MHIEHMHCTNSIDLIVYLLNGDKSELGSTQKAVKEWKKSTNSCSNEVFTMCFRYDLVLIGTCFKSL